MLLKLSRDDLNSPLILWLLPPSFLHLSLPTFTPLRYLHSSDFAFVQTGVAWGATQFDKLGRWYLYVCLLVYNGVICSLLATLDVRSLSLKHGYMGFAKVPVPGTFRVRVRLDTAGYCSSTAGYAAILNYLVLPFFFSFPKQNPTHPLSFVVCKSHPTPTSKFLILSHQPPLLNRSTTGDSPVATDLLNSQRR